MISLTAHEHLEGLQNGNTGKSCPWTPQLKEPIRYLEIVALLKRELRDSGGALCVPGGQGDGGRRGYREVAQMYRLGTVTPGHSASSV